VGDQLADFTTEEIHACSIRGDANRKLKKVTSSALARTIGLAAGGNEDMKSLQESRGTLKFSDVLE